MLTQNGNRWVGPGHDDVLRDFSGQDWIVYHAVDRHDPYFENNVGFTRRPVLIDPLDWVHGWPVARGGRGPSDRVMPAPAAQPGEQTAYHPRPVRYVRPGRLVSSASDEFNGSALSNQWSWVRAPDPSTYGVSDGALRWQTQSGDLYVDSNDASVLTEPAPRGNYVVETKVSIPDLPAEGCCHNYTQAGLVIYGDDDNFVKLASVSIWETRQTEFAKELSPVPAGYPRYGNTVVGPPGDSTWLRIIRRHHGGKELYTAYTSPDGVHWDHGGTWTHHLGSDARIGLVSMAGSGFTATFDYVRVYRIHHRHCR